MKTKILLCLAAIGATAILAHAADNKPRDEARKLFTDQPRNAEKVRKAAAALTAVAKTNEKDYDDQWHAARAWCWLADYGANDDEKRDAANKGIELAERAIQANEKKVEGHYFRARNILMLASIERGTKALGRIKEAKKTLERAIELDEKFEEAGPQRLLGLLLLDAPGWPISIGNAKDADKHIRRAVELVPAYPENQSALAKLLHKQKNNDGARAAINLALKSPPWPSKLDEDKGWKEDNNKFLKEELK